MPRVTHVGTSSIKEDAIAKAVGDTVYGDDFHLPGEIYGKAIRARMVPARIKKIEPKRALALPGVHCVLTAKDIPGTNAGRYPHFPVLADGEVRFTGDAVALVAADSRDLAEEAARLVEIEYEPLPGVYDFTEPEGKKVLCDWHVERGDVDAAFVRSDVVVENTYFSACLDHGFIEPEGGVAWMDERGVMNVRVPTQAVENYQKVATALGLPASRVRYHSPMLGGAFGGKEHPLLGAFMGLLSLRTGRPVRMAYTREETMSTGSKRHPFLMRYKTGATRDGKITSLEVDIFGDSGAYLTMSRGLLLGALCISGGPYEIPNLRGRARAVETNNPFTEAMRGVGANQVCFAYEAQMDEVAKHLGMDPLDFRRRNFIQKGGKLMQGQDVPGPVMLPEILDEVEKSVGRTAGPVTEKHHGPWRRGIGYAANIGGYSRPEQEGEAYLSLDDDGSVYLRCGASDVGAGQTHAYRQIAAETLGLALEKVTVTMSDTEVTPLAGITASSRQTTISGGATYRAGMEIRGRILHAASELLEAAPEDLEIHEGMIRVRGLEEHSVPLTKAIKKCKEMGVVLHTTGKVRLSPHSYEGNENFGTIGGWKDYTFGVHAAEVEVNVDTGEVCLLNYWASHDVGKAINPLHVEGQFEGGAMMGIGHGLTEELLTEKGVLLTDHFESYLIPTSVEAPGWKSIIFESASGQGPFGAKGVGEPPCTVGAAAVANAISQAIGARVSRIPATPDHILEVLGKLRRKGESR